VVCRHQAAAQFGVGINTAINWVRRFRETGSVEPDQVGGYRPKKIAGPHHDWLVQRCRNADFLERAASAAASGCTSSLLFDRTRQSTKAEWSKPRSRAGLPTQRTAAPKSFRAGWN
jgi:transposase